MNPAKPADVGKSIGHELPVVRASDERVPDVWVVNCGRSRFDTGFAGAATPWSIVGIERIQSACYRFGAGKIIERSSLVIGAIGQRLYRSH